VHGPLRWCKIASALMRDDRRECKSRQTYEPGPAYPPGS